MNRFELVAVTTIAMLFAASVALANDAPKDKDKDKKAKDEKAQDAPPRAVDNYDELLQMYLQAARATAATPASGDTWMSGLLGDLRARRVNDLVTVQVIESVSALGSAESALDKSSNASASLSSFFGLESKMPTWLDPSGLATLGASTDFSGSGSTARTAALSAVVTARVAEVLPNGDLALEGVREIDINGDRQILVLTGIVRVADIGPGNVVASTAVGQMRIRYFGRGLMKDNLSPGLLVRLLNRIF